jgi:hypothetical protein
LGHNVGSEPVEDTGECFVNFAEQCFQPDQLTTLFAVRRGEKDLPTWDRTSAGQWARRAA